MAYDDRGRVGVGGWLAFLILSLAVFAPLRVVASIYANLYRDPSMAATYGDRWPAAQAIELIVGGIAIAGSIYLAWRLYAVHTPGTVRRVKIGLWVIAILPLAIEISALSALMGIAPTRLLADMVPTLVRPLIYAAIWTAYLFRSDRVANTYRDRAPDELRAVFE